MVPTLVLPVLLLVAGSGFVAGCGGEEPSTEVLIRPVRWVVAGNGTGDATHTFAGSVRAGSESRLSFQVPGRVTTLSVRVGDAVEADQVIAEVDPTDLQLQLQEARASAGQAQAQSRSATERSRPPGPLDRPFEDSSANSNTPA